MLNKEEKNKKANNLAAEIKKAFPAANKIIVTIENFTGDGVFDLDCFEAFIEFAPNTILTEEDFDTMTKLGGELNCYIDTVNSHSYDDSKDRKEYIPVCF